MISIGFLLVVAGVFAILMFGEGDRGRLLFGLYNKWDYAGILMVLFGLALCVISISIYLWKIMP